MGALLTGPDLQGVEFGPPAALLFGTICSAVDPVAVSAIKLRSHEVF